MFRSLTSNLSKSIITTSTQSSAKNVRPVCGSVRNFSSVDESENEKSAPLQNVDTFKCINKVTLLGRATGPAFYNSNSNVEMASFTLATNEIRRNRANELIRRSDFHKIQVFIPRLVNKTRDVVQKGSRILVEGKINYNVRKDENGTTNFTNIIADNIVFITGARGNNTEEIEKDVDIEEESEIKQ